MKKVAHTWFTDNRRVSVSASTGAMRGLWQVRTKGFDSTSTFVEGAKEAKRIIRETETRGFCVFTSIKGDEHIIEDFGKSRFINRK